MKGMKELIQILKNNGYNTAVIELWVSSLAERDFRYFSAQELYGRIYGFIFGLQTIGYISEFEGERLVDGLINKYADIVMRG